jgi:pyruvate dehydrogenase E2 component (dihydrolipoamide acetyltransferase)
MDVPSPASGRIQELKIKVGGTVSTGDLIAVLEEAPAGDEPPPAAADGDQRPEDDRTVRQPRPAAAARAAAAAEPAQPEPERAPAPPPRSAPAPSAIDEAGFRRAHASPSVRKLARELGVELGRVRGSGHKGRVTSDDVKAFVKAIMTGGAAGQGSALPQVPQVDFAKYGAIELQPLSRIQRISGPRLHASWVNVPHVTQHDEADITSLEETRASLKDKAAERGIRLTPLAFIMRACVLALAEFPAFKSSLGDDGKNLVMKQYVHLGFAADTPQGLVVPVIRDADKMDVYEIASALAELSARAREGKLKSDDIQGGVFTVSSLGGIGGSFFTPIINAPEVAILGVSRSQWKPVLKGKEFVPRLLLPLSLSYDHRVIDGAQAARFITRLSAILGQTEALLEATP